MLEHGEIVYRFFKKPDLLKEITPGSVVGSEVLKELRIFDKHVLTLIEDVIKQSMHADEYNASFVTESDVQFSLMNHINKKTNRENEVMTSKIFSHSVSFIKNAKIADIMRVREDFQDSFVLYRDALRSALKQSKSESPEKMKQAFDDIVFPEINNIDVIVKREKERIKKDIKNTLLVGSAFLGVGYFSHILGQDAVKVVSALGGLVQAKSLVSGVSQLRTGPDKAVEDKLFFLWKLKEETRVA